MAVNTSNPGAKSHLAVRVKRPGERRSLSRTATRALDVMELFGNFRQALRAIDIGRALDLTPSTTNQLLKTMVDSGHLVFDAKAKSYIPSPRLARIGGWIVELYGSDGKLRELLETVCDDLNLVVTVSTPNDLFMQIIDSVTPKGKTAERGLRVSLFGSTIGNACLATIDDAELARLAQRARVAETEIDHIRANLSEIRQAGFAEGPSIDGEIWSIALPLPTTGLPGPVILGLAGLPEEVRPRIAEIVTQVLSRIDAYALTVPANPG